MAILKTTILISSGCDYPSSSSLGWQQASLFSSKEVSATTFRDNAYIQALNFALGLELGVKELYCRFGKLIASDPLDKLSEAIENHEQNAKALVNLIISNRGIPEKTPKYGYSLSYTLARCVPLFPIASLQRQLTQTSVSRIERRFLRIYDDLLSEAPAVDEVSLEELKKKIELHLQWF